MILQPLCISDDLGAAIAYAKKRYASIAKGARPGIHALPYYGSVSQDALLCRIVLGLDPSADIVQILRVPRPQVIVFVANEWDVPGTGSMPFYGPNAVDPHIVNTMALGDTGTVIVIGQGIGRPAVLTSTNTAVIAISDRPTTFAEAVAMNVIPGALDGYTADNCTVTGFTLTLNSFGNTRFLLNRPGNSVYAALSQLDGGEHIFRKAPVAGTTELYSQGGGRVGGGARFVISGHTYIPQSNSGVRAGGSSRFVRYRVLRSKGGAVAGGTSGVRYWHDTTTRPLAGAPYSVTIDYDDRIGYQLTLSGTSKRGGVITFRITALGIGCAVTATGVFSGLGTWHGTTSFSYVAVETGWGVALDSLPTTITVNILAPLTLPIADSFSVSTPFATRNSLGITLRGSATRGGSLTYSIVAYGANIVIGAGDGTSWPLSFSGVWHGATYLDYTVTEIANGKTRTSAVARVTITVEAPITSLANFTLDLADDKPGTLWTFTNTTPAMPDESAVTLLWEVYSQPGPNMVYPTSTTGQTTTVTPINVGAYSVKLTVTDAYGGTSSAIVTVDVVAALLPPTGIGFSVNVPWAQRGGFAISLNGSAKRGGVLSYAITLCASNTTARIFTGFDFVDWAVASLTTTPAGTYSFSYTVTETANGEAVTSTPIDVIVYLLAVAPLAISSWSTSDKYMTWTGGVPPYTASLLPSSTGIGINAQPGSGTTVYLSSAGCNTNGSLRITDAAGASVTMLLANLGYPLCVAAATWHWQLIWTCPLLDAATYPLWFSAPPGGGNTYRTSINGAYRMYGLRADAFISSSYGCSGLQMNQATGLNFSNASWPLDYPNQGAEYPVIYYRQLYQWVFS